ncbi:hypothetical protein J7438_08525 [Thalassotalea sp. G20_0]|uniref:hypothetical protein n=1 Tax=Thalassotalea sp. G20_0 TaxID=2821093 RepID=UPI001ADD39D7|nr:hypothetical protein [Thalassotalea sp. G20_0]MBO9494130.1 hypothetical protein [Thalassotalea sp. G20_0]
MRPPSGDKERTVSDAINHIDFYSMVEAELRARQQQACQTEASQVAETVGAEPIKWANKRNELLEQLNVVRRNGADDKTVADLFTEVLAAGHLARRQAQLEEIKACMDSGYVTREHYHRSQQAFTAEFERVFRRESAEPDYQELHRERAKCYQQIYRKPDIIG